MTEVESKIYDTIRCQNTAQRRRQRQRQKDEQHRLDTTGAPPTIEIINLQTGNKISVQATESNIHFVKTLDTTQYKITFTNTKPIDGAQLINSSETN